VRSLALPCFDEDRVAYERAIGSAVERLRKLDGFDAMLRDYVARRRAPRGSSDLADGIVDGVAYWRRTLEMIAERTAGSAP
jgi:hypothetical protein